MSCQYLNFNKSNCNVCQKHTLARIIIIIITTWQQQQQHQHNKYNSFLSYFSDCSCYCCCYHNTTIMIDMYKHYNTYLLGFIQSDKWTILHSHHKQTFIYSIQLACSIPCWLFQLLTDNIRMPQVQKLTPNIEHFSKIVYCIIYIEVAHFIWGF